MAGAGGAGATTSIRKPSNLCRWWWWWKIRFTPVPGGAGAQVSRWSTWWKCRPDGKNKEKQEQLTLVVVEEVVVIMATIYRSRWSWRFRNSSNKV
jgi:hypothetical protein